MSPAGHPGRHPEPASDEHHPAQPGITDRRHHRPRGGPAGVEPNRRSAHQSTDAPDTTSTSRVTEAARSTVLRADLAAPLRQRVRSGILGAAGIYIFLLLFFVAISVFVGIAEGSWAGFLVLGGEFLISAGAFLLPYSVSYLRLRRRTAAGSLLTISDHGIRWENGNGETAAFDSEQLCGIGVSYYPRYGKDGPARPSPQLELFVRAGVAPAPALQSCVRAEPPPHPGLPAARYCLLLPPQQNPRADIEQAIRIRHPHLWLGWYRRRRNGTPVVVR